MNKGKDLEENQFDSERECGEFGSHPLPAHNLHQILESISLGIVETELRWAKYMKSERDANGGKPFKYSWK